MNLTPYELRVLQATQVAPISADTTTANITLSALRRLEQLGLVTTVESGTHLTAQTTESGRQAAETKTSTTTFAKRSEARAFARAQRAAGATAQVLRRSTVGTVPGCGLTSFLAFDVVTVGGAK